MLSKLQYKQEEEKEKLKTLGQESDLKAKKWVQEEYKELEKLAKEDFYKDMGILSDLRKKKPKYYFRYLSVILMKFIKEEDVPKRYGVDLSLTDKGILLKIAGTKYQGAFKPSGLPSFDRHACKIMAIRLGNTIAKLEGFAPTTEAGVVLPDEEDSQKYANTGNLN